MPCSRAISKVFLEQITSTSCSIHQEQPLTYKFPETLSLIGSRVHFHGHLSNGRGLEAKSPGANLATRYPPGDSGMLGLGLWAFLLEGRTIEGWTITPKALHYSCVLWASARGLNTKALTHLYKTIQQGSPLGVNSAARVRSNLQP